MKTFRASGRLIGWLVVALAGMGQAPLYGDVDPSCPTCGQNGAMAHDVPTLGLPPHAAPPHTEMAIECPLEEVPAPMVRLRTRVPACAEVGKELEYRIKVENTSPADAHNVVVRMNLPASVKVFRTSPQVHQRDPELQWNLGTMPGHGCHDIVVTIVPLGLADIKSCTRVTYEHGQCVTTKVMAFAPEGSADGKIPGGPHDPGKGGPGGMGAGEGPRGNFDIRVYGPDKAAVGEKAEYLIIIYNKSERPLYQAGAVIDWSKELEERQPHAELAPGPLGKAWPKGGFHDVIGPNETRRLILTLYAKTPGRHCVSASCTASLVADITQNQFVRANDQACTEFRLSITGMTLEMYDKEDPILKNGRTSYPITVRNQGKDPITNLQIKARVPEMLQVEKVHGPGKYREGPNDKGEYWVEFEPLAVLKAGETQFFEIDVKGKGFVGDARFHVKMTADQLDKGPLGEQRWIIEEESTTLVPDEETRARIREISRKARERKVPGMVTSGK